MIKENKKQKEQKEKQRRVCWPYFLHQSELLEYLRDAEMTRRQEDRLNNIKAESAIHAAFLIDELRTWYPGKDGISAYEKMNELKTKWTSGKEEYIQKVVNVFCQNYSRCLINTIVDKHGQPIPSEIESIRGRVRKWLLNFIQA